MKRKFRAGLLWILAFSLLFAAQVVHAAGDRTALVLDAHHHLTDTETRQLQEKLQDIAADTGILLVYERVSDEEIPDGDAAYARIPELYAAYFAGEVPLAVLLESDSMYYIRTWNPVDALTEEDLSESFDLLKASEVDTIALSLEHAAKAMQQNISDGTLAKAGAESTPVSDGSRLIDDADLLTDEEEKELEEKLDEISQRQQFDVVIVTANTLGGKTPMAYADDYYDYNSYGYGDDRDGVLLLVSMEDRDYWTSTTGFAITAITDAGREYIEEHFVSQLSEGKYLSAFTTYADYIDMFVTQAKTGEPYDIGNLPKGPYRPLIPLIFSALTGLLVATIIRGILRRQMKSVVSKHGAEDYVVAGSFAPTGGRDVFVRSSVSRHARPKDSGSSSGGGGSSTHTSSSGSSHGGGGGKF